MQISNETLFSPFVFECYGANDHLCNVAILKGTFDIVNGKRLKPSKAQSSMLLADQYRTKPLVSSVVADTDLVPLKNSTDITLNSVALSPKGKPMDEWPVSVRVGSIAKTLRVTGPRSWKYNLFSGWRLTKPIPTTEVPIHYEYAYGGGISEKSHSSFFEQNPVGRGYCNFANRRTPICAPQIENLDEPISQIDRPYRPAGFGPIAKHWLPRRLLCGTADQNWKENRWPLRPLDFDFNYYNSASEGLVYPGYLVGNENVLLTGQSHEGPIAFGLPELKIIVCAIDNSDMLMIETMNLDTLHIDVNSSQAMLTWRYCWKKNQRLKQLQFVSKTISSSVVSQTN